MSDAEFDNLNSTIAARPTAPAGEQAGHSLECMVQENVMVQPVFVVNDLTDQDLLRGLFAIPGVAGGAYLLYAAMGSFPSIHPAVRISAVLAVLAITAIWCARSLGARLIYALTVAVVGAALIVRNAPDIVWTAFWIVVLIGAWAYITINYEIEVMAAQIRAKGPTAQNTAPK